MERLAEGARFILGLAADDIGGHCQFEAIIATKVENTYGCKRRNFANGPIGQAADGEFARSDALEAIASDRLRDARGQILCDIEQLEAALGLAIWRDRLFGLARR